MPTWFFTCLKQLEGYEFEQTPGADNWQGSLACYSPWGCRELDTIEWLNWTEALLREDMQAIEKTKQNIFFKRRNEDYKGKQKDLIYF